MNVASIVRGSGRQRNLAGVPLLLIVATAAQLIVAAEPAADKSELICVRERDTGSRIPRKVCRTRAAIEAERQATQDALKRMPSRPRPGL